MVCQTGSLNMTSIAGAFQIFVLLCYVMLPLICPFDLKYFKLMVNISIVFENLKFSVFRRYRNEILKALG